MAGQQTLRNRIHWCIRQQILQTQRLLTARTAGAMEVMSVLAEIRENKPGAPTLRTAYLHHHSVSFPSS